MELGAYSKLMLLVIYLSVGARSLQATMPGESRGEEEFLYMVLVFITDGTARAYGDRACTGTMIRPNLVLTLASCLLYDYSNDPDPDTTTVVQRPGTSLHVLQIVINPNFYSEDRYTSKAHDFGLIFVETTEQTVFPRLEEYTADFNVVKETCVMGGYGHMGSVDAEHFRSVYLNKTDVVEEESRLCAMTSRLCLHFAHLMPCKNGDFGSPLVCNGVLFALNIPQYDRHRLVTVGCFDKDVAVFTPVAPVRAWVRQIIEVPTSNLQWMNNPWYVLLLCGLVFTSMGGIYYGLVEALQRYFDPAENLQSCTRMEIKPSEEDTRREWGDDDDDDAERWMQSQWNVK